MNNVCVHKEVAGKILQVYVDVKSLPGVKIFVLNNPSPPQLPMVVVVGDSHPRLPRLGLWGGRATDTSSDNQVRPVVNLSFDSLCMRSVIDIEDTDMVFGEIF